MGTENTVVKGGDFRQDTYVLSQNEVESLEESLGAHQQILGASEAYRLGHEGPGPVMAPGLAVNRKRMSDQAKQIKRTLDNCRPEPVAEKDKDRLRSRQKWLEEQFRPYLETRAELHVFKRDNPAWQSAMEKARIRTQTRPEIENYIREWQWIDRRLKPGDPDAGNLHRLRVDR